MGSGSIFFLFPSAHQDVLGLKVGLISGRSCILVLRVAESMPDVLHKCAQLLGLSNPGNVAASGQLVSGTVVIGSLEELTPGDVNELTLVLSCQQL